MDRFDRAAPHAVLGPTNTGKTHLAIERMCGHSSGIIGFPLRLLAREVYDRVVGIKGKDQVALVTGEEKIIPRHARYFLCTAESMPLDRDVAFLALDEAQLGADPERGHVFTDRLLHARGREETMILGSDTLRPVLKSLIPGVDVTHRPRFSTLGYAGPKKLSRLPARSAIVAFSAEEVYAVAEMLRRLRGGAAVVMGALSPRTRNAQVAMFQAGEVDYLVATDAVGMGLNMDVAHVAFASLRKFDGRRQRRLTVSEMAQIAGRAGRHQRDGTFGTLAGDGQSHALFELEEIEAIEAHRFPPLDHLSWREGQPSLDSIDRLVADLEQRPDSPALRPAPQAIDLAVLKRMAAEDWVRDRARGPAAVARLWDACGLPDFQKAGPEHHGRLVSRIYRHLSEDGGHVPARWVAEEIARLDTVAGDIAQISHRIAAARIWAYVANRADWLAAPGEMAERTRQLEEKLSDALHERLTQRFVDRRTAVLMRDLGAKSYDALPVKVTDAGLVTVDGEVIGTLTGFRFRADPSARHADAKMLLAAAERRLGVELRRRAHALTAAPDDVFTLLTDPARPVALAWAGEVVARLSRGRGLTQPRITLHRSLDSLAEADRAAVLERLGTWLAAQIANYLAPLRRMEAAARDPASEPAARALLAALASAGGAIERRTVAHTLDMLGSPTRKAITRLGITIGALDIFAAPLLKPEPLRWRLALCAISMARDMPLVPEAKPLVATPDDEAAKLWTWAGLRLLGTQMVRVDLAERIARAAHEARGASGGRAPFLADPALAISIGLQPDGFARLMRLTGFERAPDPADGWLWRPRRRITPAPVIARPGHAFAKLADLRIDA